jgi:acyl-CoA synthetase (NDP forming)/GNAT superfamily N-acetyltransferase
MALPDRAERLWARDPVSASIRYGGTNVDAQLLLLSVRPPAPADVLLTDGSVAVIRPLRPDDQPGMEELHAKASDDSTRMRFFTASRTAGSDYVAHLFAGTSDVAVALVATVHGEILATATAEHVNDEEAEVAFLVSDAAHGLGLGTLLLEHLAAAGHNLGIQRFTADVLEENHRMLGVFQAAGFEITRRSSAGIVSVQMATATSTRALSSADDRESASEERSLAPLFHPRTVAVVGVRRDGTGTGSAVVSSIQQGGFTGRLYVVHPNAADIHGLVTWPRLVDVPEHVDVVMLAVPAARVLDAMNDAVAAEASCVVVISSGFAELGPEGTALQQKLQRLAREHSIRLVGPNCLGVIVNDPAIRLNATFASVTPEAGGLAIASQSGGVGIALLDLAQQVGLGVHSFVSLGNKADVSGNDLLAAWLLDPDVTAGALYLESFGNALKFARVAARFAERKPLLAVVGGRSAGGRRAGASHTAAAATSAVSVDALFSQAGVVACRDAHDLAQTALLLTQQPLPAGPRLGIVSNAGGLGVLAADAADRAGLEVPELSPALSAQIQVGVSGTVGISNPVDLGAGVSAGDFSAALTPLLGSAEVDAVVVLLVATSMATQGSLLESLAELRPQAAGKPVVLVAYGDVSTTDLSDAGVTVFGSVQAALDSLAHAVRYAGWLRVPHSEHTPGDPARAAVALRNAQRLLPDATNHGGWLSPGDASELLTPYDLAQVGQSRRTAREAVDVAEAIGFPVAVKVADPQIVHKSDRGLVRTGLRTPADLIDAIRSFAGELGTTEVPVLVQPMLGGVEVALGMVRDAAFGPLVMVAAGGVDIDVWDDRVFLLPPVTQHDATRALHELRIWPLLAGHRGRPAADIAGVARRLVALGQLALDVPQIAELDLNPVMVGTGRVAVVDAKVRLAVPVHVDAGIPRRLRTTT